MKRREVFFILLLIFVSNSIASAQTNERASAARAPNDDRSVYFRAVHASLAKIASGNLYSPAAAQLVADIVLGSDGAIKSVSISKSSGDAVFDQRVIDVYKGQRVPPRPAGLGTKDLMVRLPLRIANLDKSFAEKKWKSADAIAREYSLLAISKEEREELTLIVGWQLRECYKRPALSKGEALPAVKMLWEMKADGTIDSPIRWESLPMDSAAKKAVAAATDAIVKCLPLKLPAEKYNKWKILEWTFDPKKMP